MQALQLDAEEFEEYKQELQAAVEKQAGPLFLGVEVLADDPDLTHQVCSALLCIVDKGFQVSTLS